MNEKIKNNLQLIETESDLEYLKKQIEKETIIAVDLESDSMFHFQEKVCLIQIAANSNNIVIDPLKINDLSSLKPVFANRNIKKIFHGADYDVRSLHRDFGVEINNLFDTELAGRFLGIRETGLESVLQNRFQVRLNKKYQKKDWSQRPLPDEMLEYAAEDVAHLVLLANSLEQDLKEKGRLSWVIEESEKLSRVRFENTNGVPLFKKVKGAGKLDRRGLATLEALLRYRIELARKKDRPLFKVIGNGSILKIAKVRPSDMESLQDLKILSHRQTGMYGEEIIRIINNAMKIPSENLPYYPKTRAPMVKPSVAKRIKALKDWRENTAGALKIDAGFLISKSILSSLAEINPQDTNSLEKIEGLNNWQKKEFGKEIIGILKSVC